MEQKFLVDYRINRRSLVLRKVRKNPEHGCLLPLLFLCISPMTRLLSFCLWHYFSGYRRRRVSSVPDSRGTSGSRASASNGLPQDRRSCSEWTAKGSNSFKRNCVWSVLGIHRPSGKIERSRRRRPYSSPSASFPRFVGINFIRWNFQFAFPPILSLPLPFPLPGFPGFRPTSLIFFVTFLYHCC